MRPDSAAKVIDEFKMYEPVTATIHDIMLAAISETVVGSAQRQEAETESNSASAAADRASAARARRKTQ